MAIREMTVVALGLVLAQGCADAPLDGGDETQEETAGEKADRLKSDYCADDGEFAFRVRASGLEAWEGRRVVAAAMENEQIGGRLVRRALVRGRIRDGAIELGCPSALRENYAYPSWAVYVDVDRDGSCGSADSGVQMQLYGWRFDVEPDLEPRNWAVVGTPRNGGLRPALGSPEDSGFCHSYFSI